MPTLPSSLASMHDAPSPTSATSDDSFISIINDMPPVVNPKQRIRELLSDPASFRVLYRRDDVFLHPSGVASVGSGAVTYQPNGGNSNAQPSPQLDWKRIVNIPGCILLVEANLRSVAGAAAASASSNHPLPENVYFIWCPYSLLLKVNENMVLHITQSGEVITKSSLAAKYGVQIEPSGQKETRAPASPVRAPQQNEYVSAAINGSAASASQSPTYPVQQVAGGHGIEGNSYALVCRVDEITNIKRQIPTMGWSHMVVTINDISNPPLFFHDGGILTFFDYLQQVVTVSKSKHDNNTFVVRTRVQPPLQRSLHQMHMEGYYNDMLSNASQQNKFVEKGGDLSWQLLEWGTKVAKTARKATKSFFGTQQHHHHHHHQHSMSQHQQSLPAAQASQDGRLSPQPSPNGGRSPVLLDDHFDDRAQSSKSVSPSEDDFEHIGESVISDGAENVVAQPQASVIPDEIQAPAVEVVAAPSPISAASIAALPKEKFSTDDPVTLLEWKSFFDSEGRVRDIERAKSEVFWRGLDEQARPNAWRFLLGYHRWDSTEQEREQLDVARRAQYEQLKAQWTSIGAVQSRKFATFVERRVRVEKDVLRTDRNVAEFATADGLGIEDNVYLKKLYDILVTYAFYNFDLGYCQGMSDALAPILVILKGDEALSFWCFAALMDSLSVQQEHAGEQEEVDLSGALFQRHQLEGNFNIDGVSMQTQLSKIGHIAKLLDQGFYTYLMDADALNFFFCFRWVLIQFKREFAFEQILMLWERFWTQNLGANFHLFCAYAVLDSQKGKLIDANMPFDEILKHCIELSGNIDMMQMLDRASTLFSVFRARAERVISAGTLPQEQIKQLQSLLLQRIFVS